MTTRHPDERVARARALYGAGDRAGCEAECDRLLGEDPTVVDAWLIKGGLASDAGRLNDARALFAKAAEIAPDNPATQIALGRCLAALKMELPAIEAITRGLAAAPGNPYALQLLADLEARVGRTAEAGAHLEQLLSMDPWNARAHYKLATLKPAAPDDPRIGQLRALLRARTHEPRDRSRLAFALGRLLDQQGHYEDALRCFDEANYLRRAESGFDLEREAAYVAKARAFFTPELFSARRAGGYRSELPVFIVGMPRSGSTLVEQILASHPQVAGAGETMLLPGSLAALPKWMPEGSVMPDAVARIQAEAWTTLGKDYVRKLSAVAPDADRIVDKQLFNYTLVGLIRLLLPDAKIIHCTRHPMATCLSCYMTAFRNDRGFTSSLSDLGANYRLYEALMGHWQDVIPDAFLEVRYEEVVADVEQQARRITEYLGLPWSSRCLAFFDTPRAVRTSSEAQVRRPVYQASLAHWKHYAHLLEPLERALAGESAAP